MFFSPLEEETIEEVDDLVKIALEPVTPVSAEYRIAPSLYRLITLTG